MAYPLPTDANLNASAGLQEIFIYANSVTDGGILFKLILVALHCIITLAIINKSKEDYPMAFVVGGFVTFIVALLMRLAGIIDVGTLAIVITIVAIEFLALTFTRD